MVARTETRTEIPSTATQTEMPSTASQIGKGPSLARGPALIIGTVLLAIGLYSLYRQHIFPSFANFPNGHAPVDGKIFGVFGANGWTGMLTAVAGGLLLFGAAQHLVAKMMSVIVGAALGAAAVIAAVSGNVLGLAAANGWTEIAWGVVAVILLVNALTPRREAVVSADTTAAGGRRRSRTAPAAEAGAPPGAGTGTAYERDRVREGSTNTGEAAPRERQADDAPRVTTDAPRVATGSER